MGQTLVIDLGGPFVTVAFAVEDELDISLENIDQLRTALKAFIDADESQSAKATPKDRKRNRKPDGPPQRHIREWARKNGFPDLPNYGRVPADVREAYDARPDPDGHGRVTPLNVARSANGSLGGDSHES